MNRMSQFSRKPGTTEYVSYLKGEIDGLCRQVNDANQPVTDLRAELLSLRYGFVELEAAMLAEEIEWKYHPAFSVRVARFKSKIVKFFKPAKRKVA